MITLVFSLLALGAGPTSAGSDDSASYEAGHQQCASCQECRAGHCGKHRAGNAHGGIWGPMPQTCYGSRYGCYPATERYMNRYPAFHSSYYKRAYNYRNYYDYPWHAELHEPTSLFSYESSAEVESEEGLAPVVDPAVPATPPTPVSTAQRTTPTPATISQSAYVFAPTRTSTVSRQAELAFAEGPANLAPIVQPTRTTKPQPAFAPVVSKNDVTPEVSTKMLRTLRR